MPNKVNLSVDLLHAFLGFLAAQPNTPVSQSL
jgi:hypothetical protein